MRFSLRTLLIATLLVAIAVITTTNCLGPILPHAAVARIENGMTQEQVRRILGSPNGERSDDSWSYERFMNPGWLVVYFDRDGCVKSIDHEPPFP